MDLPPGSVSIRAIEAADAQAAASLCAELGYPIDEASMRARIERLLASSAHGVFVACDNDRVVGWIHVASVDHMQSEPRAEIGGLVVTTAARGAGIGARLVERAESWARSAGLPTILVRSQIARDDAHRFYLREGYARTKTSAVFTKRL